MRASERRSDYNRFPPFLPLRSSYAAPLVNLQIFLKSIRGTFCAARVYHHGGKRAQTKKRQNRWHVRCVVRVCASSFGAMVTDPRGRPITLAPLTSREGAKSERLKALSCLTSVERCTNSSPALILFQISALPVSNNWLDR